MSKRITLLGLSGVGKSTFIERINRRLPLAHLQASELIKAEQARRKQRPENSEDLRKGDILENQTLMIAAFNRIASDITLPIILDGHSIIDSHNGLIHIPDSVFSELRLDSIFHLSADPHTILQQRVTDTKRKRPVRDADVLAEQQRLSEDIARRIAKQIGCHFIQITNSDINLVLEALR